MKTAGLSRRPLTTAVLLLVATVGLWFWLNRGPRYEGRTASYWVGQLLRNRIKARQALLKIGPAAVPPLADAVRRSRSRFRAQLDALRPRLPGIIARRLPNRVLDQALEERAIEVLYEFGPAAAPSVPALLEVDANLNDLIGFGSAGLAHVALVEIGPAGVPYFVEALDDADPTTRAKAAAYLGHLGPDGSRAAPALAKALNDPNPNVRNAAVAALGQIGPPASVAIPALKAVLDRTDDEFRLNVVDALWKIGHQTETALPVLIRILSDPGNSNRPHAATSLGEMGPAAKTALPALSNVLQEEFSYTRVKAEEAIKLIRVEPAPKTMP